MNKTKMNRRDFLRLGMLTSAGAILASCAPKTETPAAEVPKVEAPTATAQTAAQPVKIQIMWRTNPDENKMLDELIKVFQGKHPDITVESIYVPWDEYEPKLMTMYTSGIAPDVYGTGGTNPYIERWVRGMVLELDEFVNAESSNFTQDIFPVGLNAYRKKGKLAALAFCICPSGVWVNATRFDEASVPYPPIDWTDPKGWSWEEVIATAKKLTNADEKKYGFNPSHAGPWYYTRMWGKDLVSKEDYESGILHKIMASSDTAVYDALVAGLQARADTMWKDKVAPSPDTANSLGQIGPMLKTGAIAMEFTGGWAVWGDLPKEMKFRAAINPKGGVGGSGTTCKNIWADPLEICSKTKAPDQSWKLVRFIAMEPDAIAVEGKYRNVLPVSKSVLESFITAQKDRLAMPIEDQIKFYKGAIEQAETTVPDHILVGWAKVRDVFNSATESLWLNEKTAKEVVDDMLPKAQAAIDANLKELNL